MNNRFRYETHPRVQFLLLNSNNFVETLDAEQQTVQSTHYEETCIDKTNALDDCSLSVNQQLSHVNEKLETEENQMQ